MSSFHRSSTRRNHHRYNPIYTNAQFTDLTNFPIAAPPLPLGKTEIPLAPGYLMSILILLLVLVTGGIFAYMYFASVWLFAPSSSSSSSKTTTSVIHSYANDLNAYYISFPYGLCSSLTFKGGGSGIYWDLTQPNIQTPVIYPLPTYDIGACQMYCCQMPGCIAFQVSYVFIYGDSYSCTLGYKIGTVITSNPNNISSYSVHLRSDTFVNQATPLSYSYLYTPERTIDNVSATLQPRYGPIRGWNSFLVYYEAINEASYRGTVEYMAANLAQYGYNYVMIDADWFTNGTDLNTNNLNAAGYQLPWPTRFPSSGTNGELGFGPLATWTHSQGMYFGFHIFAGIPYYSKPSGTFNPVVLSYAYNQGLCTFPSEDPITIGDPSGSGSYTLALLGGYPLNQAWYNGQIDLFASWGVDIIKLDCVNYHTDEASMYALAIAQSSNPNIILIISSGIWDTGTISPQIAALKQQSTFVDAGRVNLFDNWPNNPQDLPANTWWYCVDTMFQMGPTFQGSPTLKGLYFPFMDDIPIGQMACNDNGCYIGSTVYSDTASQYATQRMIFSVWCFFRSPLIISAVLDVAYPDLLDATSMAIVTNPHLLEIHGYSWNLTFVYWGGDLLVLQSQRSEWNQWYQLTANVPQGASSFVQICIFTTSHPCDYYDVWNNLNMSQLVTYTPSPIPANQVVVVVFSNCPLGPATPQCSKS